MKPFKASGAAAAASRALLGLVLRAVIDKRSRSSTSAAESLTFAIVAGASPAVPLPTSHAHEAAPAVPAFLAEAERGDADRPVDEVFTDEPFDCAHVATSVLTSPANAPEPTIFA
jgi:hypothetical protein